MKKSIKKYKSICSYCGVGCGVEVTKDLESNLTIEGDKNYPVNNGMLCAKGFTLNYVVNNTSDRLLYPQIRSNKNDHLKRVSWDEAMIKAAEKFRFFIDKYGPDSVAFYVSGQCLTEEYYLINKLTKGFLGTNNIDSNSRLCMSSAVVGYLKSLGEDSVPICYDDIELSDTFFIAGANPAWCHPIIFKRIDKYKEKNPHVKVIVVDPRKTQTCSIADLHLQIQPGTDTFLYHAIAKLLIESEKIDLGFINNHLDGYQDYKKEVLSKSIQEYSLICDIPIVQIKEAAKIIGDSKAFISMWAMGLNQSGQGVNKNLALIALSLITGQIGKPGAGPFSLTGQPNAMGGREVGALANLLAVHKNLDNAIDRQDVATYWGVDKISGTKGLSATEMFKALGSGKLKAVWIVCTNPLVSLPNSNQVENSLAKAEFVVVQDISNKSDTIKYADLVLPASGWFEKEGVMTNSERRMSYLHKGIDSQGEALPDAEIICKFANAMGFHGFNYQNTEDIFKEHAQLTKGTKIDISDLTYERLKKSSIQWPYNKTTDNGTERLFTDYQFYTPNKKAQLYTIGIENISEQITKDYPLILTTGRIRDQWHTMTRTGKVNKLNRHMPTPFLEINRHDAKKRDIKDGAIIEIFNQKGKVKVHAVVTDTIKKGVVFLPMHWGKILDDSFGRANNITSDIIDPISKEPDFKYATVEVTKYQKPKQKIVIIGAGSGAYRFLDTYREINSDDEILIFSNEGESFYNRVLLPDYINSKFSWEILLKVKKEKFAAFKAKLYINTTITAIDNKKKEVIDHNGHIYSYDKLIISTGSRAFVPPSVPIHFPCVFTLRSKKDADNLKNYIDNNANVVIVGGGLLGLELTNAIKKIARKISIVELNSTLMQAQLDDISSGLLKKHIEENNIDLYLNDQVEEIIYEDSKLKTVCKLKSGKTLQCTAIVYAIGTRPNIELAKEIDLVCGRGIKVNEYLQTSDPDIFAIGEVAEFKDKLNGTVAAAEAMADIASKYLSGDNLSIYQGTIAMNILKFSDLDLCSLGTMVLAGDKNEYEEIILLDKAKKYYKKCIIWQDKLIGAILMGDKLEFAEYKSLISLKIELGENRNMLLKGKSNSKKMEGKLVCSCANIGDKNIEAAIKKGFTDLKSLCDETGAGLACGSCKAEVKDILEKNLCLEQK
ncbi:MAG: molybdopterin-dependent oxidoreductase [Bacteroidetes bacterium]|nr:molybdopterin-dependent oxidoreductase [Bacteroidota bacterium]